MCSGESKAHAWELHAGIPTAGASNNPKGCFKNMKFAELCTASPWVFQARWDPGGCQLGGAEMCCNSMSLLSFPTLHCKSIAKPSMESVTCAGLCLYEPGAALLSYVPCGQVSGIWCPAGQSRGTRFWHMEPSSQDEAGLGALVQRSLSVAISLDLRWLWEPGALVSLMPASWLPAGCGKQPFHPSC